MALPYENATSGKNAIAEMQKICQKFGADDFGIKENFKTGNVLVQFEWNGRTVQIEANAKGYAAAWLREHPHTNRMRTSKSQHEAKAIERGNIAVYSILRDWIKGQVTAVEIGMLTFEGAFLGQILLPDGRTVLEHAESKNLLPKMEQEA